MTSSSDRIEKTVVLRAPLERVWRIAPEQVDVG